MKSHITMPHGENESQLVHYTGHRNPQGSQNANWNIHEQRMMEMRQEAEIYRQQLELERLKYELHSLRGNPVHQVLPSIPAVNMQPAPANQVVNVDILIQSTRLFFEKGKIG